MPDNCEQRVQMTAMERSKLERMSVDELWALHAEIYKTLMARIVAQKSVLEERLNRLSGKLQTGQPTTSGRRPYPPVLPKFRNPENSAETWTGRGKQPRWVAQQLRSGKQMEELRIRSAAK